MIVAEKTEATYVETYELTPRQRRYLKIKRAGDFVLSLLALVVLIIPFLLVAILQKISSPNEPVFFRQRRVGQNGHLFYITKFRSMKSSAPKYSATGELKDSDAYISRLGRFLRDTSIDELPQFFQVLTGKMSIIGPRPLIPQEREVHRFRKYSGVYQLCPGITGWAQVNGRDLVSDEEKEAYDLNYLKHMCFGMDLKIFWLTVKKVFRREGVREGTQVTRDKTATILPPK